ncbi:hypothetical protein EJB05_38521, partial [Eragrostis curvula]
MYARAPRERRPREGAQGVSQELLRGHVQGIAVARRLTNELMQGWRNETVIAKSEGGDRVILVTDENSRMRNSKVYLYISCQRIVVCLVTEPIKTAHKRKESSIDFPANNVKSEKTDHTLEFGKISFKREILRRHDHTIKSKEECRDPGAIICEEEAVPAICGFRSIWVKRIGSKLMDVARKSFCEGQTLGLSQLAFTPPTFSGKALACRYCNTSAFLGCAKP